MTLAVTVGLSAFGGIWLDRQFGTKPWLMLLLVVTGIVGSMLHLIRVAAPEMWPFGDLQQGKQQGNLKHGDLKQGHLKQGHLKQGDATKVEAVTAKAEQHDDSDDQDRQPKPPQ